MTLLWLYGALLAAVAVLFFAHRSHTTVSRSRSVTAISNMLRDKPPMTGRAKAYLWIGALRTWPVALACYIDPPVFHGPAFEYLRAAAPIWAWGIALTLSGALSASAALTAREWLARTALITSASLTACWAIGFAFAAAKGNLISPLGITWGLALAAKDLVVCRQPLWSPFEQLVRKIRSGEAINPRPRHS